MYIQLHVTCRPLNSHGLTARLMVSGAFSRSNANFSLSLTVTHNFLTAG